jgi:hypothetical protein
MSVVVVVLTPKVKDMELLPAATAPFVSYSWLATLVPACRNVEPVLAEFAVLSLPAPKIIQQLAATVVSVVVIGEVVD